MLRPNINPYNEFDNEKNSCGSEIPYPPPHDVCYGPSPIIIFTQNKK